MKFLKEIPFDKIGAFVFEPGGSGIGFVHFPPRPLVEAIAGRVRASGGLIVANEITTGIGRTGKWFGFQHYDIQPDIVALGKGLGNGYPVSAVAVREETAEKLERGGFHYVQSHQNDPLGCAIAREVIAALHEEKLIERGAELGAYFLEGLREIQTKRASGERSPRERHAARIGIASAGGDARFTSLSYAIGERIPGRILLGGQFAAVRSLADDRPGRHHGIFIHSGFDCRGGGVRAHLSTLPCAPTWAYRRGITGYAAVPRSRPIQPQNHRGACIFRSTPSRHM